ncbi:hypothetical protein Bca4012_022592 [Brassica carinata]
MKCLKTLLSAIIIVSCHLEYGDGRRILSIKDFITDTNHANVDYSQVFQKAWKGLCEGEGEGTGGSSLVINESEKYTIKPQLFEGPCVSSYIHIQIDGKIEAPKTPKQWGNKRIESWLMFKNVESLFINGSGVLHPHGETWWRSVGHSKRPRTLSFMQCTDIIYNGLTQYNSPRNHISVDACTNATLSNLTLLAPKKSPNTDGIDICLSHNIRILDSSIQTGDDCIAITGGRGGSSDINITRVACGPGHGISIGSLGKGGIDDTVENVIVRSCSFWGTQNGARIKTWHGGKGETSSFHFDFVVFGTNSVCAFALNLAVFLLVGKTSALTMNVAGVVKDWLLIAFSWSVIKDTVTPLNLFGYGVAFLGVAYYNHCKLQALKAKEAQKKVQQGDEEAVGKLLEVRGESEGAGKRDEAED